MIKGLFKGSLTIPNLLTALRIVFIPVFVALYYNDHVYWALLILVFSGLSDTFDGAIARRFNQVSELGKILDPVADKLTQITLAIMMFFAFRACESQAMRTFAWVFLVFLIKEAVMVVGGLLMLLVGIKPGAAEIYGKIATTLFYIVMSVLVALGPEIGIVKSFSLPESVCMILVAVCAILTLVAFGSYMPAVYRQAKERFGKNN